MLSLRREHPIAFGYLESCQTSTHGEQDRYFLERTFSREVHIGRGPQNDLVLGDPHISWAHAKITYTEYAHTPVTMNITAKKTKNGTFVNGERLKAGQTRKLVDGDTVSFGVFKKPQSVRWRNMNPDDTLEGRGLDVERQKLSRGRWQFTVHAIPRDDETSSEGIDQILRTAWNGIIRCKEGVHTARTVLARMRGFKTTCEPTITDGRPPDRPSTPAYTPPPADRFHPTNGKKADYRHGDEHFCLIDDLEAPSLYHPDIIWRGIVRHKPNLLPYELPSDFKYWSSVYGIPQGLHPRWSEFSSAVYGDDCPDVGRETSILKGFPAIPRDYFLPLGEEENIPQEGLARLSYEAVARHCENVRLYKAGKHPETIVKRSLPCHPAFKTTASDPPQVSSEAPLSKKRKLEAGDGMDQGSVHSDTPSIDAIVEPPRKRTKRDARPIKRRSAPITVPQSQAGHPAALLPAHGTPVFADGHRVSKRARTDDEETPQARPAKRPVREAAMDTPPAPAGRPSRSLKRSRPPARDISVQEPPATRLARVAGLVPSPASDSMETRPHKRRRPERNGEENGVDEASAPPVRRTTRSASIVPNAAVFIAGRPLQRRREAAVSVISTEAVEAEDVALTRTARVTAKTDAAPRSLKRRNLETDDDRTTVALEPPAQRMPPAIAMQDVTAGGIQRSAKRRRKAVQTVLAPTASPATEDVANRRSSRLRGKTAPRYR
ncbi:unnamed protein product [Peniophora sp. CBMAI 1063]|nr:unnamed protein product [Peniophora sp. CBMAI 1063]